MKKMGYQSDLHQFFKNNDYLITTFPVADVNQKAPFPIVFPQIADGGGYVTQFILLNTSGASSVEISCYDIETISAREP
jgi:hypothetical protein